MADLYPVVPEFGYGSCTCNGSMTGCAVCAVASVLKAFRKPVPLTTDPRDGDLVVNARALGASMGQRHRMIAAPGTDGARHGLSLAGYCTGGTNWCAKCAALELVARGLPASYVHPTDAQLLSWLKARYPIIIPGRYGRIPLVSTSSYSSTKPARGRSDATFTGWHMVVAYVVDLDSNGKPKAVIIVDADFGSASRRVIPPHSIWTWSQFLSYYHATGGWGVCVVKKRPPTTTTTSPSPLPTGTYSVVISGPTNLYSKVDGVRIGTVTSATYLCKVAQGADRRWWRIVSGKRTGQAFKPNSYTDGDPV